MGQRQALQVVLEGLLESSNVYFQPPASIQMQYPCIVYQRYTALTGFADGIPYVHNKRYQVTVIDQNPDSLIPDLIAMLPLCVHNRFFVVNNLNHDVFNLYY
jgi:hypothetical protein